MSRFLVLGSKGMLGRAFRDKLASAGHHARELDLPELDISERSQVEACVEPSYAAVINCAAYTNVDRAESEEPTALRVNAVGPGNLAEVCRERGVTLVHFSTDYVFSGSASVPYPVDEPLAPLNAYGRTKAEGEIAIRKAGVRHLILRTSWLYAPWANNFVRTMVKLSKERDSLKVVDDQRGRPTSAEQLAQTTLDLLGLGAQGTLHATDGGECTWFEFAREIVRLAGARCAISPCSTAEFPRPAKRPVYSVLDIAPTEKALGKPLRDWHQELADVMRRLEP